MTRTRSEPTALTIGQLAKRWAVAPTRVRQLVEAGHLEGVFRIPSAGKYGETVKIPLDSIIQTEQAWALVPSTAHRRKRRRRPNSAAAFEHFPEFLNGQEPSSECREDDQR